MEPRPPRPRSQSPLDRPSGPDTRPSVGPPASHPAGAVGSAPGPDVYPPQAGAAGAYDGQIPLVPRVERRRRRLTRAAGLLLLLLAALGAAGFLLRDRLLPDPEQTPPAQVAASPALTPAEVAAAPRATRPPAAPTAESDNGGSGSVLDPPAPTAPAQTAPPSAGEEDPAAPVAQENESDAAPSDQAEEDPAASDAGEDESEAAPGDLAPQELLPTEDDVPAGLVQTEEDALDRETVLTALGGTDEADGLLDEWGWDANAYRYFATGDGETTENGITNVTVSIHRFGDEQSAADALQYFSDYLITTDNGYEAVDGETIGDQTRWLRQETEVGTNIAAYLSVGNNMVRIGGFSPTADPAPDVATIAQTLADA